jgi:hypothetical protein
VKTFKGYFSERFVGKISNRRFGHKAGFWLSPKGELVGTSSVHVRDIIDNPSKFGMTDDLIQKTYDKYNEPLGQEGKAREELISMALTRGWIRVRKYARPSTYWSVTVNSLDRKTKENIESWVNAFEQEDIMGPGTDVKILQMRSDRLKTLEVSEIQKSGLQEGKNTGASKPLYESTFAEQPDLEPIDESSLSRIWRKTQDHTCGSISGYRDENTRAENKNNNKIILNYLQGKGYSVTSVQGSYIENFGSDSAKEVKEPSFFVANDKVEGDDGGQLERDLVKMGRKTDQDSVLVIPHGGKGAYLVGTSRREEAFPSYGEKKVVGSGRFGKAAKEFLSRIQGRKFAFEEISRPGTRNGKWAQSVLVNEIDAEMDS